MQVNVETTGPLTRKMTIAVPSAEFEDRITERIRSTAKKVSLPGFRRGRVPLREVERRFGSALRTEVATEVVQSSLEDAVHTEEISLAGTPTVDLVNVEAGADLEFTATFEVLPEIELVDLASLRIQRPVAEIQESDIDEMVESLRQQRMRWDPVERPVAAGDRVVVDYSFKIGGETQGEPRTDFPLIVGRGQLGAELDTAVVGMSAGESRAFPMSPMSASDAMLDLEMIGEVTLKSVEGGTLPELDEAFYASFGVSEGPEPTFDTAAPESVDDDDDEAPTTTDQPGIPDDAPSIVDRFRDNVRERMSAELDTAARNETRRQVMGALARAHAFDLPRALVDEELAQERQRMARFMGVPEEKAELGEPGLRVVEERLRTQLVVREIVEREGLEADDQRIQARVEQIATAYEQPEDVRNWIYGDEEQLRRVELDVLEDQLIEYILARADVESVPASYKAVVTGNSIPAPTATPATSDADIDESPFEPDESGVADAAVNEADEPPRRSRMRRWLGRKRK